MQYTARRLFYFYPHLITLYCVHIFCPVPVPFLASNMYALSFQCLFLMKIILWQVIKNHPKSLKLYEEKLLGRSRQRRCSEDPQKSDPNPK
jgi:hypothetical protein